MEPTLSTAVSPSAIHPGASSSDAATEPMWRYMLRLLRQVGWLLVLFVAFVMWVSVRLDCQQLQKDLDLNRRETTNAKVQTQQLSLELAARRSIVAVEREARANGLDQPARVVPMVATQGLAAVNGGAGQ